MSIEYMGLSEINGPLIVVEGVEGAFYDEIVEFSVREDMSGGNVAEKKKLGRIVEISGDKAVIQVFDRPGFRLRQEVPRRSRRRNTIHLLGQLHPLRTR